MKLFELIIEDEFFDGIKAISLVEDPAIEHNFVWFDKEKIAFQKIDKEKRLVVGPLLIPNKKILRIDGEGQSYNVYFSPETIERLAQNYLKQGNQGEATIEHKKEKVKGVTLVESWVKTSKLDKSNSYGLNLPLGSWVGVMKIDNDEIWNEYVKSGETKGFSIEGIFEHKLVEATRVKKTDLIQEEEAEYLLNQIKYLIKEDKRYGEGKRIDLESYSDYPESVKNNAKKGIELNEKGGNKCATQVGKVRGQQLAKGEPISVPTIKRMYSYLSRAQTYYDEGDTKSCGYISYMLWGGLSAKRWANSKLKELGVKIDNESQPSIPNSSYPGESGKKKKNLRRENRYMESVDVYGYVPAYFYMCPVATTLFKHLTEEMDIQDEGTRDMIRAAAVIADSVFLIEEEVIEHKETSIEELRRAETLVSMFKDVMKSVDERTEMKHDVSFMDGHIDTIKSFLISN
tara:strand:+ start:20723 stop:22096 length:1374 start_codon:yes stop_codon:yes gene_type:complete